MSETQSGSDVMTKIAGVVPGSAADAARALRPDVIKYTQASDDAVLRPNHEAGFSRAERAAVGLRIARLLNDGALVRHYESLLEPLDPGSVLAATTQGPTAGGADRWSRMLAHVDLLTKDPGASRPEHLRQLEAAGLSSQQIVALSQLIAYVNYQSRARAGLHVVGAGAGAPGGEATLPATKAIKDFTKGEMQWDPWLTPVDLDHATSEQQEALKITPSNRAVGAYALVLAHDPDSVKERSPLYNAIMFGPKGLARADRELGATVASRINGCAYCASVHAKRFVDLAKEPDVMERLYRDGLTAKLDPRRAAIVDYAAKLTSEPSKLGPKDAAPLRAQGLSDGDILDLTNAVAMFGWANRLMQSLGTSA